MQLSRGTRIYNIQQFAKLRRQLGYMRRLEDAIRDARNLTSRKSGSDHVPPTQPGIVEDQGAVPLIRCQKMNYSAR